MSLLEVGIVIRDAQVIQKEIFETLDGLTYPQDDIEDLLDQQAKEDLLKDWKDDVEGIGNLETDCKNMCKQMATFFKVTEDPFVNNGLQSYRTINLGPSDEVEGNHTIITTVWSLDKNGQPIDPRYASDFRLSYYVVGADFLQPTEELPDLTQVFGKSVLKEIIRIDKEAPSLEASHAIFEVQVQVEDTIISEFEASMKELIEAAQDSSLNPKIAEQARLYYAKDS